MSSPQLMFDKKGLPRSEHYNDHYYSRDDGAAETRHVFIEGCELPQRLTEPGEATITVGELGFGTGLNFLSTWALLRESGAPEKRLHFWSVDQHPMRRTELEKSLAHWPQFASLAAELCAHYPPPVTGLHRRVLEGGRVILDCVWASASDALGDIASLREAYFDAWFLDGFAPARNPRMWEPALLAQLARTTRQGGIAASYSAAGDVRRALAAAGFKVNKRPGHGSKRECIAARLDTRQTDNPLALTPWDQADHGPPPAAREALVLGAGLGGAHAAAALARRGFRVTVLESGEVAGAASGNAQGVLFSRLSHQHATLSDFSLLAQGFAAGLYRGMFARGELTPGRDGELNGCFQMARTASGSARLLEALSELPELASFTTAADVREKLGAIPADGGFWQPEAGWLSPPAVCRALLADPAITLHTHCGQLTAEHDGTDWSAVDASGNSLARAPVLVIATACDTPAVLEDLDWLPLRVVRGQTSLLPADALPPLKAALCHEGYIAPARDGQYCIGATFAPGDHALEERDSDNAENLEKLAAALPQWEAPLMQLRGRLTGRPALRTTTPDYLPMAGAVPARSAFLQRYRVLASDARALVPERAPVLPNCYLSAGYGSRGLSYAALGGELIAAQLCGEPPPLSRALQRAVSPARFLLRALVRGQVETPDAPQVATR